MPTNSKIIVGITGRTDNDWQGKLEEIDRFSIKEAAVFLERFLPSQRNEFYKSLEKSMVKTIPLVHIRSDVEKEELEFFIKAFKTKYFTIHENHFPLMSKWKSYRDKLYLELNYDNQIAQNVIVAEIGGFCIDLAHFKAATALGAKEAYFAFLRRGKVRFACNHISGYSPARNRDIHLINNIRDFDYLTDLPKYVFGKVMAIEIDNSIAEQLEYREYIAQLVSKIRY